ncbi:Chlorophyll a-b binding protein 6 [Hibiscus syriacus]|uniref:Chlorophyll a-b binding protein, chloroplastic n=1 Tax=Hibiscus syriacus TaxID=106335 RepID=A0A6A3B742_HIBSY|nr:Chlorophyll a-b binding protein 6 [Hibiscus syriacus]
MTADWMPGQPRPPYLDGSAPGDFGLTRLDLVRCRRSREPGILVPEALGYGNWVKAQEWAAIPGGQATYLGNPVPWGTLQPYWSSSSSPSPSSHHVAWRKDTEKKKYPGGAFRSLGYSKDPKKFEEYKVKEIKNGTNFKPLFFG